MVRQKLKAEVCSRADDNFALFCVGAHGRHFVTSLLWQMCDRIRHGNHSYKRGKVMRCGCVWSIAEQSRRTDFKSSARDASISC